MVVSTTERGVVRLSANIRPQEHATLRQLAEMRGTSITRVIVSAIKTQQFFDRELERGSRIYREAPDGETTELVFVE